MMTSRVARPVLPAVVVSLLALTVLVAPGHARTIGQIIDDATITTEITAKLAADTLSNLTKIGVKAQSGIVTLSGTVASPERRARAAQIASAVDGVKGIVNNIEVPSSAPAATAPAATAPAGVEATGTVATVDQAAGTITLEDGRVLKVSDRTVLWQPTTVAGLTPGTQVLVQGAVPAVEQPGVPAQRP